jgi:hypothetical protein
MAEIASLQLTDILSCLQSTTYSKMSKIPHWGILQLKTGLIAGKYDVKTMQIGILQLTSLVSITSSKCCLGKKLKKTVVKFLEFS